MSPAAGFDYFETEAHYSSLAGRIIAALGGFNVIVLTGEPPPKARMLSRALTERAASRHKVIEFSCQLERGRHGLVSFGRNLSALLAINGTTGEELGSPPSASPLVVFDDATELSDEQIQEIFKPISKCGIGAAVLVANSEFLTRLERPVLRFWLAKRLLVARFRFQELGADEISAFIRHRFPEGEEESPFTNEAIAAIASVSGGDPMVVNRFSNRLLALRATRTSSGFAESPFGATPTAQREPSSRERGATESDEPPPQRIRRALELNAEGLPPTRRGRGALPKLSVATAFCVACLGMLTAAWIMAPTREKPALPNAPAGPLSAAVTASPSSTGEVTLPGPDVARSAEPPDRPLREEFTGTLADPSPTTGTSAERAAEEGASSTFGKPAVAAPVPVLDPSAEEIAPIGTPKASEDTVTSTLGSLLEAGPTPAALSPMTVPPHLSAATVAALLPRGDRFFALGDLTSARLCYERAADAGDGQAALRLGMTFDPEFLSFARVYAALGDRDKAVSWYRRASLLGDNEAAILLKRLDTGISK